MVALRNLCFLVLDNLEPLRPFFSYPLASLYLTHVNGHVRGRGGGGSEPNGTSTRQA